MNRNKKMTVGGLLAGSVAIGGLALAVPTIPGPAVSMDITGGSAASQIIRLPQLDTPPTYGQTIDFSTSGGASGNPVTVSTSTPDICTAGETAGQLILKGVGSCSYTLNQAGNADYEAAAPVQTNSYVRPAPLTIKMRDQTRASDAPNPEFTPVFEGLVNGDTPEDISGLNVAAPPNDWSPGRWTLRPWGATSPNYDITFVNGTLTINPVIKVEGLPAGVMPKVVFDGGVRFVSRLTLVYGSSHSYTFAPLVADGAGETYVTTAKGFAGEVVDDRTVAYTTMPALISTSTEVQRVIYALTADWYLIDEQLHAGDGTHAVANLHALATRVRSMSGGDIPAAKATALIEHLQVVYNEVAPGTV